MAAPLEIAAGQYFVLGRNADVNNNGGIVLDYAYGSAITLSNSDDEIILTDAGGNEIDRVEYDGGPNWPDPTGASMALLSPFVGDNNDGSNWVEATEQYGVSDRGTPGVANFTALPLVITEVMQNPTAVSDGNGEWFELYNPGTVSVDINGWVISDNGSDSHTIDNGGPLIIEAGGYLVLGNNADMTTNGGRAGGLFLWHRHVPLEQRR